MKYLYGDSTPSPLQSNYLFFVRDAMEFCVHLLLAQERINALRDELRARERDADAENNRIEGLRVLILEAARAANTGGPGSISQIGVDRVIDVSAQAIAATLSDLDSRLAAARADIARKDRDERDGCNDAFGHFVALHHIHEGEWRLGARLDETGRYIAETAGRAPWGAAWQCTLDLQPTHPMARGILVGDLVSFIELSLPEGSGWQKRHPKRRPQRIDGFSIDELITNGENSGIALRATPRSPYGVDIEIAGSQVRAFPAGARDPFDIELGEDTRQRFLMLRTRLVDALTTHPGVRRRVVTATFDDTPFAEADDLAAIAKRVTDGVAPMVKQIRAHSLTPNELVIRRLLDDNSRVEIFVSTSELLEKLGRLPRHLRSLFEPLGLEWQRARTPLPGEIYVEAGREPSIRPVVEQRHAEPKQTEHKTEQREHREHRQTPTLDYPPPPQPPASPREEGRARSPSSAPPLDEARARSSSTPPPYEARPRSASTPPHDEARARSSSTPPPDEARPRSASTPPHDEARARSSSTPPPDEARARSASTPPHDEARARSASTPPHDEARARSASTSPHDESRVRSSSTTPADELGAPAPTRGEPRARSSSAPPDNEARARASSALPSDESRTPAQPANERRARSSSAPPDSEAGAGSSWARSDEPRARSSSAPPANDAGAGSSWARSDEPRARSSSAPPANEAGTGSSWARSDEPRARSSSARPANEPRSGSSWTPSANEPRSDSSSTPANSPRARSPSSPPADESRARSSSAPPPNESRARSSGQTDHEAISGSIDHHASSPSHESPTSRSSSPSSPPPSSRSSRASSPPSLSGASTTSPPPTSQTPSSIGAFGLPSSIDVAVQNASVIVDPSLTGGDHLLTGNDSSQPNIGRAMTDVDPSIADVARSMADGDRSHDRDRSPADGGRSLGDGDRSMTGGGSPNDAAVPPEAAQFPSGALSRTRAHRQSLSGIAAAAAASAPMHQTIEIDATNRQALAATVKRIIGAAREGSTQLAFQAYAALFEDDQFAVQRPQDQRQVLKLLVMAKTMPPPSYPVIQAYRSALARLHALAAVTNDPLDQEMIGVCERVLSSLDPDPRSL